jgi:hypothetical protein
MTRHINTRQFPSKSTGAVNEVYNIQSLCTCCTNGVKQSTEKYKYSN